MKVEHKINCSIRNGYDYLLWINQTELKMEKQKYAGRYWINIHYDPDL